MPRIRRRFLAEPSEVGVDHCINRCVRRWMQLMKRFRRLFRRAAGRPQSLQREREQRGCQAMQGIRHSPAVFF